MSIIKKAFGKVTNITGLELDGAINSEGNIESLNKILRSDSGLLQQIMSDGILVKALKDPEDFINIRDGILISLSESSSKAALSIVKRIDEFIVFGVDDADDLSESLQELYAEMAKNIALDTFKVAYDEMNKIFKPVESKAVKKLETVNIVKE